METDVRGTHVTGGFANAVERATKALDNQHSPAQGLLRLVVTERRGREASTLLPRTPLS